MARPSRAIRWARVLLALTVLAPLVVFVAVAGTKTGVWDWRVGYSLLTLRLGFALAALGAVAAIGGIVVALGERKAWPLALVGLVFGGATAAIFALHLSSHGSGVLSGAPVAGITEATTDRMEPPGFSGALADRRVAPGATAMPPVVDACDAASIPTQVAPGAAAYALREAGFDVLGFGVGRADGTRSGFWFGFTHDAVIRIRPGRTDVRVAAREARPDGGEACRLLQTIVAGLQPGA